MTVTITVEDAKIVAAMARLRASATNTRKVNEAIGFAFGELVAGSFDDGKTPWGETWDALKPSTIARRRKGSSKPLLDKGLMRASIESRVDDDGVEISVGRADRPAAVHQFGNPRNRMFGRALAPIPARPFLPIDGTGIRIAGTEYEDVLMDIGEAFLAGAIK